MAQPTQAAPGPTPQATAQQRRALITQAAAAHSSLLHDLIALGEAELAHAAVDFFTKLVLRIAELGL